MSLTKITDATTEPFDAAAVKVHLHETLVDTANDALITRLIKVARTAAEERTERTLLATTWQLNFDTFPAVITLERPPIVSVAWIKYIDAAGTLQTLDPALYQVDIAKQPGRISPVYGQYWPQTRPCTFGAVTVRYTAGYADAASVPETVRQWILLAVSEMYELRNRSAERPTVPHDFADYLLTGGNTVWSV